MTYSYSGADSHAGLIMGGAIMTLAPIGLGFAVFNAVAGVPGMRGLDGSLAESMIFAVGAVLCMVLGVWAAWFIPRVRCNIALSADGVVAYLKGKPWRFIAWREMVSITRSIFRGKGGAESLSLVIRGPRYTIQVAETIDRFADLCVCLTQCALEHHVPLRASDGMSKESDVAALYEMAVPEPSRVDEVEADRSRPPYAGTLRRFGGAIVDIHLVGLLILLLGWIVPASISLEAKSMGALLYWLLSYSEPWQATPGQRLLRVHVTTKDGSPVSQSRALLRIVVLGMYLAWPAYGAYGAPGAKLENPGTVFFILSVMVASICYVPAWFTRRNTAVHDLLSGTCVRVGRI